MAICDYCNKEMTSKSTKSCTEAKVEFPRFPSMDVVLYPVDAQLRCHDCGVAPGGIHHPGCDAERCPRCHGQLIACGCLSKEEEQDDD